MDKTVKVREPLFDVIKAIAIFMVAMQHCYLHLGNGLYKSSAINQAISLISVPTFMMVCGYFMYSSKWTVSKLLLREKSLLLPFLFWSLAYFLFFHHLFYNGVSLLKFIFTLISDPYFCSPLWFFRTLAIITLITFFCRRLNGHYDVIALIILFIGFNIITVTVTKRFAIQSLAGNMGYFIIGYILHKYNIREHNWFQAAGVFCAILFFLFISLKINKLYIWGGMP